MVKNRILSYFLLPLSLLYYCIIETRNLLYDAELLKSVSFDIPIISVGNLSIGGAGKTPHVEFLVSMLNKFLILGSLSRGYKRKTKGFRIVNFNDSVNQVGDESLQLKRKYQDLNVCVSESRVLGVTEFLKAKPDIDAIILDDAFQHRSIKPGLNILLTEYSNPYFKDKILPSGRLRESQVSSKRADIVIVTKCPKNAEISDKYWKKSLNLTDKQSLFFTQYIYDRLYSFYDGHYYEKEFGNKVIFISAIADTTYLKEKLKSYSNELIHLEYEDHHMFNKHDITYIKQLYQYNKSDEPIIITTEKDAMRLSTYYNSFKELEIPIYILPIRVKFLNNGEKKFEEEIRDFLLNFKV